MEKGTKWLLNVKYCCLLLTVYCSLLTVLCKAQPGVWQTHFSYRSAQSVGVIGQQVFAATRNGFYVYDKTTTETRLLTRADGLSDVSISRILALPDQNRLMLAYRSGNIDFLSVSATGEIGEVRNINTIPNSDRIPAAFRAINHINRVGNVAYLSTDFGVVAFDLARNEIRDTYFSRLNDGLENKPNPVQMTAVLGDSLYALFTGWPDIKAIRTTGNTNFTDPANWRATYRLVDYNGYRGHQLVTDQGRLVGAVNAGNGSIYSRTPSSRWTLDQSGYGQAGVFAASSGVSRLVPNGAGVSILTIPGSGTFAGALLQAPREVVPDGNRAWIADTLTGMLEATSGNFRQVAPAGPYANTFEGLFAYPNQLIGLPGFRYSLNTTPRQPQVERYDLTTNQWDNNLIATLNQPFTSAAYLPAEQRLFLGTAERGLWSQTAGQAPVSVTNTGLLGSFLGALATDAEGNLWVNDRNNRNGNSLIVRRPNGQFEALSLLGNLPIAQIVPDDFGLLWLRLTYGALLVFNPKTGQQRYFSTAPGDGNLPGNNVTALAKDRNGLIWVGTDRGVTVFDDPSRAFAGNVSANAPIFERRRLLGTETITAIAVDGGNRKWIATESALYRFGPDGTTLENRFTPDDSPLPSTNINALVVEPVSGRVFISTSGGLVSYGGVATEPAEILTGITIFPNPVRPDFGGLVAIRGLTDNATVKILDAAGLLVYETPSQGGTATWNLTDYRGRTAQTGVYLVVVVRADGTEGVAGKLAVVR